MNERIRGPYNLRFVWMICLVAAMGGLLFGYDWVVIGGAKPFYQAHFDITDDVDWFYQGWATSSALVGCLLGAVTAGMLSDRFGRKRLLITAGLLFVLSAIGTALAWDFASFNAFRLLGGIGIGLASNLSPMYIAEISPAEARGRFVSINQLTIVIGVLAAQVVNWIIASHVHGAVPDDATVAWIRESWHGQIGWRWMFGSETLPAFLFFVLMFFVPESPRWLLKYGRDEEAAAILTRVGGAQYAAAEVADVKDTLAAEEIAHVRFADLLEPKMSKILALGVFLAVFQQWCGINVIFTYAEDIFKAAGSGVSGMMSSVVATGVVNLIFTFVAIGTVDRLGRRPLMLIGATGLAGIYAVMGAGYYFESGGVYMLVLVLAAVGCYSMSLAPITWVVISEVFPNRIRGAAMSVAVFSLWVGCTVLTFTFPRLEKELGMHGVFWLYGAICLAGLAVIWRFLPETKGKSLEDIERELVD